VDDLNEFDDEGKDDEDGRTDNAIEDDDDVDDDTDKRKNTKRKKRKAKGWVFRSTVRCSTYRPPTVGSVRTSPRRKSDDDGGASGEFRGDEGLTYHDFHLAMSVDVEANREEVRALLRSNHSRD